MDKEFSEGFMHDMADLIEICMEHKTDNIELNFEVNGRNLTVEFTFKVS